MTQPNELADLSLTIARHELAEMRTRLLDAAGGNREVVRKAAEIVRSGGRGARSVVDPQHLALELLTSTYQQITEGRETGGALESDP